VRRGRQRSSGANYNLQARKSHDAERRERAIRRFICGKEWIDGSLVGTGRSLLGYSRALRIGGTSHSKDTHVRVAFLALLDARRREDSWNCIWLAADAFRVETQACHERFRRGFTLSRRGRCSILRIIAVISLASATFIRVT